MKLRTLLAFSLFITARLAALAASDIDRLDSLLTAYQQSQGEQRLALGRSIIATGEGHDDLISIPLTVSTTMPRDSVDFMVYFAAERFYYLNSYFEESLALIDRALALSSGATAEASTPQAADAGATSQAHLRCTNNAELHATLLCDRGYCLFKTGRNAEAAEAELTAERFAREHRLLLPLARSYNYLAIIDISLGYTDEAKHFVEKAIETDALTGSDRNTHNYLGIACEVYNVANEPDRAVEYGLQAVEAARKIGYDAGVVNHLSQLSYAYNRQGNLEKALEMSQQAVATVEQMPIVDRNLLAISLEYVAFNLLDMKRNGEAVPVIRRAIALQQEVGNTRSVCYDHKSLAEALEPSDPRGALAALRRYSQMMDSLHNDEMHAVLSRANAELRNTELQDENSQERRQKRLIISAFLLVGLLSIAVIAALVYAIRTRNRTVKTIRRLQAVREEFFTNITHEFRTPLTVIRGLAEQQGITPIVRNADQLLKLVNQLLDIAKVKAAVGDARWERTDVVPLLTMLVENHQQQARQRGVTLTMQAEPTEIVADHVADYVQKVVDNLLGNALKYTPRGGSVVLSVRQQDRQLKLTVSDTGCGIHPDDLPHIFEPFYQSRHTPAAPGSGVGLAFCREIAIASHADISAESTLGQGSAFTLTMPLRQRGIAATAADAGSASPTSSTSPTSPSTPVIPGGKEKLSPPPTEEEAAASEEEAAASVLRVLVVEDNRDVAEYIGSVLQPDYEVVYASDGAEGVAKAEELVPDVIVTDVVMPTLDGLELCRRIRANFVTDHIPVIIITARVTDEDRLQGIAAGADAYLTKPFHADELRLRIEKLLEMRRRLKAHPLPLPEGGEAVTSYASAEAPAATPQGANPTMEEADQSLTPFITRLNAVIDELMGRDELRVTAVASQMNMSVVQLARKLRAEADDAPSTYIVARRMALARRLLEECPQYNMTEVAMHCGYSDSAHFSHVFRRVCGVSPTEYVKGLRR